MRLNSQCCTLLSMLLITSLLSACFNDKHSPGLTSLGSFPKSITFDNEDNAYIATVNGSILRHDGAQLTRILERGNHGLDFAEKIRFAQGRLYIHNRRYSGADKGYINEVLLFSTNGEYIDRLISDDDSHDSLLNGIVVNHSGQLYSIADIHDVLRINYDKQNLIRITPLINIDNLTQDIADKINANSDLQVSTSNPDVLTADTPQTPNTAEPLVASAELNTLTLDLTLTEQQTTPLAGDPISITLPLLGLNNLTVDRSDNIYMSGLLGVFMFDRDGNYIKTLTASDENNWKITHSLTTDPYGNIITATYDPENAYDMSFSKFHPDGSYAGKLLAGDMRDMWTSIQDICFDSAGNFYVVDFLKGILKFNQAGQFDKVVARPH